MRKFSNKRKQLRRSLASSIFVLLTIPVAVAALLSSDSFDPTSQASDRERLNCSISFVHVNPLSLAADKKVQLEIRGEVNGVDETIKSIELLDDKGVNIFSNDYSEVSVKTLSENFTFERSTPGTTQFIGTMESSQNVYPCKLTDSPDNAVKVLANNGAPTFLTNPANDSDPSLKVESNVAYKYLLKASDTEGDTINYHYSFTPGDEWLVLSEVANGTSGDLQLNLAGTPTNPGSYFANVFIHDGYSGSLSSQSWVISVEQGDNDLPVVEVDFTGGPEFKRGERIIVTWEATDLNQILNYKLYYATNPANTTSWVAVNEAIQVGINEYSVETTNIENGSYRFILQATDNQNPAGIGSGFSRQFSIDGSIIDDGFEPETPDEGDEGKDPDDGVELEDPQIINIKPDNRSVIENKRPTISATLLAGEGSDVDIESIDLELDGVSQASKLKISEITKSEVTVILTLDSDLAEGEHKIDLTFKDTGDSVALRSWTFTVEGDGESDEDVTIFGYKIPRRTAIIIGAGLALLLLALVIPWLLYLAWRDNDEEEYDIYTTNTSINGVPPRNPYDYNNTRNSTTTVRNETTTPAPVNFTQEKTVIEQKTEPRTLTYNPPAEKKVDNEMYKYPSLTQPALPKTIERTQSQGDTVFTDATSTTKPAPVGPSNTSRVIEAPPGTSTVKVFTNGEPPAQTSQQVPQTSQPAPLQAAKSPDRAATVVTPANLQPTVVRPTAPLPQPVSSPSAQGIQNKSNTSPATPASNSAPKPQLQTNKPPEKPVIQSMYTETKPQIQPAPKREADINPSSTKKGNEVRSDVVSKPQTNSVKPADSRPPQIRKDESNPKESALPPLSSDRAAQNPMKKPDSQTTSNPQNDKQPSLERAETKKTEPQSQQPTKKTEPEKTAPKIDNIEQNKIAYPPKPQKPDQSSDVARPAQQRGTPSAIEQLAQQLKADSAGK